MVKKESIIHEDKPNEDIALSSKEKDTNSLNFLSCLILSHNDMDKTKLLLIKKINEIIAVNHLNQKDAASLLEVDQPKISQMKNNKMAGFSMERLFKFFTKLGWKVKLTLEKR